MIADTGNRGCRVVVARPPVDPGAAIERMAKLAAEHLPGRPLVVEDTFGTLPLEHHGFRPFARVPVMVRDVSVSLSANAGVAVPGWSARSGDSSADAAIRADAAVRVIAATSAADVDSVERLMVDALPLAALQPWRSGVLFPPDPANIPGWVMWLGLRGEVPTGCCATFDDGHFVGLYGMAVDAASRRQGVGRALLDAILARYSGRASCLTSTNDGFWLYASAGYCTVGQAAWWGRERP